MHELPNPLHFLENVINLQKQIELVLHILKNPFRTLPLLPSEATGSFRVTQRSLEAILMGYPTFWMYTRRLSTDLAFQVVMELEINNGNSLSQWLLEYCLKSPQKSSKKCWVAALAYIFLCIHCSSDEFCTGTNKQCVYT